MLCITEQQDIEGFESKPISELSNSCRAAGLCRQNPRMPQPLAAEACHPTGSLTNVIYWLRYASPEAIFTPRLLREPASFQHHFHYVDAQLPVLLDLSIASRIS
jgi:hypothetical protein